MNDPLILDRVVALGTSSINLPGTVIVILCHEHAMNLAPYILHFLVCNLSLLNIHYHCSCSLTPSVQVGLLATSLHFPCILTN